jgi:hypothetical protein
MTSPGLLILLLTLHSSAAAGDFYAAPVASPNGDGSMHNPWSLQVALAHPREVNPGDTIWLWGGVYRGRYVSKLTGMPDAPIVVRSFPGEWVTLDGNAPTTLASAVSPGDLTITVMNSELISPGFAIRIDHEELYVKGKSGNTLSVVRGWSGTAAAAHPSGSLVHIRSSILLIEGAHTWYWGFEVMSSDPLRVTQQAGSAPIEIVRGSGIEVRGPGTKLINLIVHDAADAIGLWAPALNAEVHGCLTYHTGWQGPDRGHGHGLYIQNQTGTKLISDVISFNNFATGMKVFGVTGFARGVDFDGVVSFNNGSVRDRRQPKETNLYIGTGENPADLITIKDSILYHTPGQGGENIHMGYQLPNNGRASVLNNYVAGGGVALDMSQWQDVTVTGNTFHVSSLGHWSAQTLVLAKTSPGFPASAFKWNSNAYFDGSPAFTNGVRYAFTFNTSRNQLGGARLSFEEWKSATGYDQNAVYVPGDPQGVMVFVRPNRYEPGRAHVAVFNWDLLDAVEVDLSQVLKPGDLFDIRDAQDYFGAAVVGGLYDGSPVVIPMRLEKVAAPVGNVPTLPPHTAPLFGAFVVITQQPAPALAGVVRRPLPFHRARPAVRAVRLR